MKPPLLFAFVKSKCFASSGTRVCVKEHHSCMRRVIDMSCGPNAGPWKVMARAVRGVVQASKAGFELFELRDAIPRIREAVASLAGPVSGLVTCQMCQEAMVPELKASTYDVDQAFESCRNDTVVPGWLEICKAYGILFGGLPVLVKRGRRNQTRHGQKRLLQAVVVPLAGNAA